MRAARTLLVLMLSAAGLLASCGSRPDLEGAARLADSIVVRIKSKEANSVESTEARKIHFLDFDKDGKKDAVVFFTVAGGSGNHYSFYMSALRAEGEKFAEAGTLRIGANGMRHINFDEVRIENGAIVVRTTEYAPDDPMCCPSKQGFARFEVAKGKIRELAGAPR